jgi:vancomycin resistance protein YoaR
MLLPSRPAPFAATLAAAALVVAGLGVVGLSFAALPRGDAVAAGVHLAGEASSPGEGFERAAQTAAKALLERPLRLTLDGRTLVETTPAALGATADVAGAMRRAQGFGRQGGLFARALEAWATRRSGAAVAIPYSVPVEPLAEVLALWKEREDRRPRDARLDPTSREVSAEEAGRAVDVYATADALERALDRAGRGGSAIDAIDVALLREEPRVTGELARSLDVGTAVSRFETHYGWLGGQAGRARNVALAASRIHGLVLLPGVVVSFNDAVGPRSLDAGFANAPEIYKGEMREGVGGGTCQVASTLHAAAFFGGLTIASRANHSRPSAYIPVGLDATVVYPDVDLRLENTLPFPVVVDARAERGALVIELRGPTTGPEVTYRTEVVGVSRYRRKIERTAALPEGEFRLKQAGKRGMSLRKTRTLRAPGGAPREEVTLDVYPPVAEIYQVGPGTDVATALPPLPEDAAPEGPLVARVD